MGINNRIRRKGKKAKEDARKSRQRKQRKEPTKVQTLTPSFYKLQDPFGGMDPEQHKILINEIARNGEQIYQETLSELRDILRQTNPLLVLSHTSSYKLTIDIDATKGVTKPDNECEIFPFHGEILQALSLQIGPEALTGEPLRPDMLTKIWDKVKTLCEAHNFRQLDSANADLPDDEWTVGFLQQLMRATTERVRNWGYHYQVKRISRELYRPFDSQLLESRGFTTSDIFDVFEKMLTETETRQSAHLQALVDLFRLSGTDKLLLIENYHELIGLENEKAERFIKDLKVENRSLDDVHHWIIAHYGLRLPDVYTFLTSDLSEALGLDEGRVNAILDEHALPWGGLCECESEDFHLSNPVWDKPLIKLSNGKYFCALPATFFSFVIPCMESILSPIGADVSNRHAEYLESAVSEVVEHRFPDSNIKRNFKWTEDGTTYETDLIAFIDSFALIIECKSGKITPPAFRGAPDRLREKIQKLLIAPSLQSLRLKKRLEFLSSHPDMPDPIRDEIGYNLGKVRKVVRISVCLEDFGFIQSNLRQLENTDWLPEKFEPCPTMILADFEMVFDILEHPVQILHYLLKREGIESNVRYLGDEHDLLGLYLTTLLDTSDADPDVMYTMDGLSAPLDTYYNSLDAGVTLDKPQPMISPLFASILSKLEQHRIARWTEIGVALSMFSPDGQNKVARMLKKLEKGVHKNWKRRGHKNMVISIPSRASGHALAYVMFKNGNADGTQDYMNHAVSTALESNHVQTVTVVGRNIDRDDVAYDTIALFESPMALASDNWQLPLDPMPNTSNN